MPDTRYVFALYRPHGAHLDAFRAGLLGATKDAILKLEPSALSIDVALPAEMGGFGLNAKRDSDDARLSAIVSATFGDPAKALELRGLLDPTATYVDGYAVTQDVPRDYERDWELGEVSPGVRQVTLLRPKPGLEYAEFLEHWHGTHGPLALEIHPIWRYDRNVIDKALNADAAPIAGFVALHFRELEDAIETDRLYGGDEANVKRIQEDVASFIDMKTIVVVLMEERVYR